MPEDSVDANAGNTEPTYGIFFRRYSVFFGIVNTDIGIGILKYPISVRFFGIASQDKVLILHHGPPYRPKLSFPMGAFGPHLTHDSLGPSEPTTQTYGTSIGSALFAQMTAYFIQCFTNSAVKYLNFCNVW